MVNTVYVRSTRPVGYVVLWMQISMKEVPEQGIL